jgi:hypothetical protein
MMVDGPSSRLTGGGGGGVLPDPHLEPRKEGTLLLLLPPPSRNRAPITTTRGARARTGFHDMMDSSSLLTDLHPGRGEGIGEEGVLACLPAFLPALSRTAARSAAMVTAVV